MLETPEARARLRRRLETWPDDKESPITINQGLELLNILESLEKENEELRINNLLPCPFCGATAQKIYIGTESTLASVYCTKCGASTPKYTDMKRAIKHWNKRQMSKLQDTDD